MSRANSKLRSLSEHLIACESRGNRSSGRQTRAAFLVCDKLRPHLATLLGNAGFRALLSRALALAAAEVHGLRAMHIKADGTWEGSDDLAQSDLEAVAEGGVVLISQLLGLLVAFIGESLTLQLLREAWPKLSVDHSNFGDGDKQK